MRVGSRRDLRVSASGEHAHLSRRWKETTTSRPEQSGPAPKRAPHTEGQASLEESVVDPKKEVLAFKGGGLGEGHEAAKELVGIVRGPARLRYRVSGRPSSRHGGLVRRCDRAEERDQLAGKPDEPRAVGGGRRDRLIVSEHFAERSGNEQGVKGSQRDGIEAVHAQPFERAEGVVGGHNACRVHWS